ncbi:restriction endonuclease, partial [Streptomyces cellulosae]
MPERRTRALRPGRRFDLRSTAVFFGLLAAALVIGGLAIRALAGVLERRPVWAVVLVCLVVAVAAARGRRRRLSAAGITRATSPSRDSPCRTPCSAID